MEDPVTGGISPILGVGLDENTGLLVARVPSFCPSSLWSGFPSPSLSTQTLHIPGPDLQPPPQARPYFHPSCSAATFPLLPGFPHPHLQHSAPPPRPGPGGRGENRAASAVKAYGCFSIKKGIPSPPALPHPQTLPHPHDHSLCPWPPPTTTGSHLPHHLHPFRIPLSLVLASRPGACTGRTSRCLGEPPAAW